MSLSTTSTSARLTPSGAIRSRVNLVCAVLVLTALAFIPIGLAWPTVSDSGTVLGVDDVQPVRDSMWLLIMLAAVLGPLNASAQAIAVLMLVREKAASIATWGAVLMIVGCVVEAVGIAGFAAAYFYASDVAITHDAATQVYDAIAADHTHLLVLQLPGHLMLTAGIVTQAVALFRARVVPWWVPTLTLAILLTYAFPGSGVLGMVSVVPMTAGCIAIAYFARRRLLAAPGATFRASDS
jgi:hypothetical protein